MVRNNKRLFLGNQMTNMAFIKNLYTKCKMHGSGEAQVVLSDGELLTLISIAISDLGWDYDELGVVQVDLPDTDYYKIPITWLESQKSLGVSSDDIIQVLASCFRKNHDFGLYIENLSTLHRRRVKYKRILSVSANKSAP